MISSRAVFTAIASFALQNYLFVDGAVAQARLRSGIYEGLMLAVDEQGGVTGYFREAQGSGVTKACRFFLAGRQRDSGADVATWNIETFPGSLQSADQGVVLRIANGRDHPGCASVLPPLISEGLPLDLDSKADWTSLRRVTAKKSFLFRKPNDKSSRSYVVKGDVVGVLSQGRNWLSVEYANEGKSARGWIRAADTAELRPPQ
jgi:hypothetical protein